MKTYPKRFVLYYFLIIGITVIIVEKDDDYIYMSKLLKALTPTPIGWSNNTHLCKWNDIVCRSNRVVSIKLPSSSLQGTLPSSLDTLTNLIHIDLHNNSLTGPLPFMSGLVALQTVSLSYNNFTSILEFYFMGMPALQTLNLSNNLNLLPWLFPKELSECSLMHTLDLEATNILGSLPSQMFDWFPSLYSLVLSHNNFQGSLPASHGKSGVRYLKLDNQLNRFEDTIDMLSFMKFLSQAWLHNNAFKGEIPKLSNCTHLFDLQLHSNLFAGLVPPSLLALSSLTTISLDDNLLKGPIPVFHKGVKATWKGNHFCRSDVGPCDPQDAILLEIFKALEYSVYPSNKGNDFCSDEELFTCRKGKIVGINFGNLQLVGTISPAFSNLTNLVILTLAGNSLTGPIPYSLTTLPHLQLLDVSNNNLSGQIPKFPSNINLITNGNVLLGQNTSVSLDGGSSKTTPRPGWIAGASLFSIGIVILIVVISFKCKWCPAFIQRWIFKKIKKSTDHNVEDFIQSYNLSVPIKQYRYAEVKRMTNSFRDKLGQGGYGIVYKAILPNGRQVEVKVINETKGNGEEFINEVASISRTSHVNIVALLGFCYENKRALIYEFMPRGSLDTFIFKRGFSDVICNFYWKTLYQIAIGIARGLEYLHQGCTSRILHLDIKPQNLLLDENFCPKISDFGLAKICQRNDSIVSLLGKRGTIGYIALEVFSRTYGGVSHKSDVYSYDMLILEMIGGRKNYDTGGSSTSDMCFPDWIYKDLEQGNNFVKCIENSEEENGMVRMITMVSLWCIQTNPLDKPSMNKVIEMLQGSLQALPFPPKPYLYTPEIPSSQQSYVSSSYLLETNSSTLLKIVNSNKSGKVKNEE
ncbi:receptor-like kinase TMK4 [Vicia villosa]|uniref:receptor-like kinase TMK4 n=1 Tax=Vicia villosa TaxID=3911 RepID=UPI00273A95AD|nr:receptor-like kinase TMK4 [Vicia villosa]